MVLSNDGGMWTANTAVGRIEDALREIATLFIALAPLDVFLGEHRPHAVRNGLIFIGVGLMIFLVALYVERKRSNG